MAPHIFKQQYYINQLFLDNHVVVQCILPEIFDREFCQHCGTHSIGHESYHLHPDEMQVATKNKRINMPNWYILYRR